MEPRTRRIVRWTAALAATGALAAWGLANAYGPGGAYRPGGHGFGPGMMMGSFGPMRGLMADLDLSDEQKTQLRTIARNGWEQSAASRAQLDAVRQQIEASVAANGFDEAEVRALVDGATPVVANLAVDTVRRLSEMRAVLTPEQQQRFDARRAEFEARRAERRARRSGGREKAPASPTGA